MFRLILSLSLPFTAFASNQELDEEPEELSSEQIAAALANLEWEASDPQEEAEFRALLERLAAEYAPHQTEHEVTPAAELSNRAIHSLQSARERTERMTHSPVLQEMTRLLGEVDDLSVNPAILASPSKRKALEGLTEGLDRVSRTLERESAAGLVGGTVASATAGDSAADSHPKNRQRTSSKAPAKVKRT